MRRTLIALVLGSVPLAAASCDKDPQPAVPPAAPNEQTPPVKDEQAATDDTAGGEQADAKADEDSKKFEEAMAKLEKRSKKKAERWTPELKKQVAVLLEKNNKNTKKALKAILASEHRAPGNAERDKYRHPTKTLTFFGVKPNMKVFEVGQGAGWYTEILAPLLAKNGKLYIAGANPNSDEPRDQYARRATELFISSSGNLYEKVEVVEQPDPDKPTLGEPGSLDMILVIRMLHNFQRAGLWDKHMPAIHEALKKGGVLAVVQHRAAKGADPDESAKQGYLPQDWLVKKVESYGFELQKASELNANDKDTKDHPEGVWTLPPTLALGDQDKDKYVAIGESDRMTLKFVKVAKKAGKQGKAGKAGKKGKAKAGKGGTSAEK